MTDNHPIIPPAHRALGALCAVRDYDGARQDALSLSHEELADIAVFYARMHAGSQIQIFEQAGLTQEQARQRAAESFRTGLGMQAT